MNLLQNFGPDFLAGDEILWYTSPTILLQVYTFIQHI